MFSGQAAHTTAVGYFLARFPNLVNVQALAFGPKRARGGCVAFALIVVGALDWDISRIRGGFMWRRLRVDLMFGSW